MSGDPSSQPRPLLLLVDDDSQIRQLLREIGLREGFEVLEAADGVSALDLLRRKHVDLVLLDLQMPQLNGLDVLHAGSINPNYRVEPSRLHTLLDFLRRNYKVICADLSGNLERHSLELMQEAKAVLLVCTPEVPSLHLAREKMAFLKSIDVKDRVSVVLNRVHKKPLFTPKQVEELLGVPVIQVFANDYHGVNRAVTTGTTLTPNSEMGKQFAEFGAHLINAKVEPREPKHRFLEFLTVPSRPAV